MARKEDDGNGENLVQQSVMNTKSLRLSNDSPVESQGSQGHATDSKGQGTTESGVTSKGSFHGFKRLPKGLRDDIWKRAAPGPRVVPLGRYKGQQEEGYDLHG
ncbi:hypothetical protein ACEPPN_006655 [Leptodophora sp. 'Broadleaf-Isolate-01']